MNLNKIYKEELINKFKETDYENYLLYKNVGLTDDEIIKLLENSLSKVFNFFEVGEYAN